MQYVRNLNPNNFFSVYHNSFNRLTTYATQILRDSNRITKHHSNGQTELIVSRADDFINLVTTDDLFQSSNPNDYQTVRNIKERKNRLIQDNFILASNFNY